MIQLVDKYGNSYGDGKLEVVDKYGKIKKLSPPSTSSWGSIIGVLSTQLDLQAALNNKQNTLVSSTNIKTINGSTILGSGDLIIPSGGLTQQQVEGLI